MGESGTDVENNDGKTWRDNARPFMHKRQTGDETMCDLLSEETKFRPLLKSGMREMLHQIISNGYIGLLTGRSENTEGLEQQLRKEVHFHPDLPQLLNLDAPCLAKLFEQLKNRFYHAHHRDFGFPLSQTQILALYLYTSSGFTRFFADDQRHGLYNKWKFFDHALYWAIFRLSLHEERHNETTTLYCGLNHVHCSSVIQNGYFTTYLSCSRQVAVADFFKFQTFFFFFFFFF
ncbi:hypothetical protein RFI_13730 [Reticulomyxa filosa]|uniref:Uncharacterized protein n=1 Tax=Reticulomyxa filosa TaxID=46433 RepID=X6NDP3_RETFI|nr:hypothetical protein RFI_13730 [Reticulomyxa filosa]|eukprot:ETO23452.1 hypothetical protein RFI_13730 [Reticulomyxa filosa]